MTPDHAARLRAYALMEGSQGGAPEAARAGLVALEAEARASDWPEVEFLAVAGQALHLLLHESDRHLVEQAMDGLVVRAEPLGSPALVALALALRAVTAGGRRDSAALLADAGRAVALVDDSRLVAEDRSTVLVVCAAAYNSLGLWELVDELYDGASELAGFCEVAVQEPAVAVNRILIRMEWAAALFELGEEQEALEQLGRAAAAAVDAEGTRPMPHLWRLDVLAAQDLLAFVRHAYGEASSVPGGDVETSLSLLAEHRSVLEAAADVELLPLLDAFLALGLHRLGRRDEAVAVAGRNAQPGSTSSGSRTFPVWVRAHVHDDGEGEALEALRAYGLHVAHSRWTARHGLLSAARSRIVGERMRVEHARLTRDVQLDPLTGLFNRRGFDAWLSRPPRAACFAALILVDLDDFKDVNDQCGHAVGDEVLRRVAHTLTSLVRADDMALRLGGDEFAIVMTEHHESATQPGHPGLAALEEMALDRARELGKAVSDADWHGLVGDLPVRVSLGVAAGVLGPDRPDGAQLLYREADVRLYEAKAGPHDLLFR